MFRCGVKDLVGPSDDNGVQFRRRRKRYALQGSRWSLKTLTYRITKYPSTYKMTHKRVDYEIERAFKVSIYSRVRNLTTLRNKSNQFG